MGLSDFDYDCLQRKRLARQAFHKKNGSKSRRCPMSTDHMTLKEWKERNGEVVSVNFEKPTSWKNFKKLSKEVQEEYLRNLSTAYGANTTNLAEMFDVSTATIRHHIQSNGLAVKFPVGHSMNREQRAAWEVFLGSTEIPQPTAQAAISLRTELNPEIPVTPMQMNKFSLSFSGEIDVDLIADSLKQFLGGSAVGQVEIVCSFTHSRVVRAQTDTFGGAVQDHASTGGDVETKSWLYPWGVSKKVVEYRDVV